MKATAAFQRWADRKLRKGNAADLKNAAGFVARCAARLAAGEKLESLAGVKVEELEAIRLRLLGSAPSADVVEAEAFA